MTTKPELLPITPEDLDHQVTFLQDLHQRPETRDEDGFPYSGDALTLLQNTPEGDDAA